VPTSTPTTTPPPAERDWPLAERLAWARRFGRLLGEHEGALVALAEVEVHKPRWECLTAEIVPLMNACRWHARHARGLVGPRRVGGGGLLNLGQRHRVERSPLGRVGIIATWNYPVLLAGQHLLQALVGGNRVVFKPSERSPRTQRLLCRLVIEAGCPPEFLEVIEADREAGSRLASGGHGPLDHLVFTGSTEVGRAIASALAPGLTTCTLELSGRDSALVLEDADPVLAARTIWWAASINAGQTCMAPRRALVHAAVYDEFVRAIAPRAARSEPRRLIDAPAAERVSGLAARAIADGGRSASGVFEPARGDRFRPVAIVDCQPDTTLIEGRHFGPALGVVRCDTLDEMLAAHRSSDQHLATSIYTARPGRVRDLAPALGVTTVTINDTLMPTAHPATSIGGVGASGWGLTQGRMGLEGVTRPVFVSVTPRRIRPPVETPDPEAQGRLGGLLMRLAGGGRRTPAPGDAPDPLPETPAARASRMSRPVPSIEPTPRREGVTR
jgi:acyl-CoA reductase-like NAD-dependent aldehyde dehydrogenase